MNASWFESWSASTLGGLAPDLAADRDREIAAGQLDDRAADVDVGGRELDVGLRAQLAGDAVADRARVRRAVGRVERVPAVGRVVRAVAPAMPVLAQLLSAVASCAVSTSSAKTLYGCVLQVPESSHSQSSAALARSRRSRRRCRPRCGGCPCRSSLYVARRVAAGDAAVPAQRVSRSELYACVGGTTVVCRIGYAGDSMRRRVVARVAGLEERHRVVADVLLDGGITLTRCSSTISM